MESAEFYTRYNAISITSIQSFADIRGGLNGARKDVYFIRCIGSGESFLTDIEAMDKKLWEREQKGWGRYCRLTNLPVPAAPDTIARYSNAAETWMNSGQKELSIKMVEGNPLLKRILSDAFIKVREEFRGCTPGASSSMEKNFITKMMYWLECLTGGLIEGWSKELSSKFVLSGAVKKQEYLFCYLLTMLGIDVMLFLPSAEDTFVGSLARLSALLVLSPGAAVQAPPYRPEQIQAESIQTKSIEVRRGASESTVPAAPTKNASPTATRPKVNVRRPDRDARQVGRQGSKLPQPGSDRSPGLDIPTAQACKRTAATVECGPMAGKRELPFEELAKLASSVVMITVHDKKGEVLGTGSGIMIGSKGYILTNNHVAAGGRFYSVRIEDEEKIYKTDEMIKYNPLFDLAVIRIDRLLKPIPLYQGKSPLVRGQKVVAIGSPLGLFNSVSDGIISGFRHINDVDMIQFTAPISHGSSGGAVLNMFGEVIGISTAGFDGGQNINLAVDYSCISNFVRGFV